MKVLLIGGTGILSSDIRELSVKKGHDVYILNRGINKVKNSNDKVKSIICDIRNVEEASKILSNYHFDVVIDFISFNLKELKNTLGIFNGKCNQYIFISSATVYRKTSIGEKITEDFLLENNSWDYAKNKIECEKFLNDNYKLTNQKYTVIRPYVTYSDARIPFAIIPHSKQWTLANRILSNKPILLWDGGNAVCTLTYSKDFAIGVVGLFGNKLAYNEAFHITSDNCLTWREALEQIGKALGKKVIIANVPSCFIIKKMPELEGVLLGDKGLNREFCNDKIKKAVPEFNASVTFEDGIKNVIEFYKNNKYMQEIDYSWDAKIDKLIYDYSLENSNFIENGSISDLKNKYVVAPSLINKIIYIMSKTKFTYNLYRLFERVYIKISTIAKMKKVRRNKDGKNIK